MLIVSFKPKIPKNYDAFCSASESNNQNPRQKACDLPFIFRYIHITSLKSHLSLARGERLLDWFWDNFYGHVCFHLPVERILLVYSL